MSAYGKSLTLAGVEFVPTLDTATWGSAHAGTPIHSVTVINVDRMDGPDSPGVQEHVRLIRTIVEATFVGKPYREWTEVVEALEADAELASRKQREAELRAVLAGLPTELRPPQ